MSEMVHLFHIPVMGTSFTIDTPIKVARYGISSVISCVDDVLLEKVRRFHCTTNGLEYQPIHKEEQDSRARRITAYLNLVDQLVREQFEKLRASAFEVGSEITTYFEMLPDHSALKEAYQTMLAITNPVERSEAQEELRGKICPGSIDINIMTKLDGNNSDVDGQPPLPESSYAMAALRGYANSVLTSAVEFSAGFNARLYSYVERFKDFHADDYGRIKKQIILKVNDFRSALTQGKFFAKKSLWVSEYRVESGLNCGGHAFGNSGSLLGPVLEEFKREKHRLVEELFELYNAARKQKGKTPFDGPHPVRITAQGGIGTALEQSFLMDHYRVDATGWGTPFLLVPEATTTDFETRERLRQATEEDLYLSETSPMGVPFNNLRTSPSELAKQEKIRLNEAGYICRKGYLRANTEFTEKPICVASRWYQQKKLEQLAAQNLAPEVYREEVAKVVFKTCLCNDLAGAAVIANHLQEAGEPPTPPAVCPGPNLAYFSKVVSLREMVDHIYGRGNILVGKSRPHMMMAELKMVVDFFRGEISKSLPAPGELRVRQLNEFKRSIEAGIQYYRKLIHVVTDSALSDRSQMITDLESCESQLQVLISQYPELFRDSKKPGGATAREESQSPVSLCAS
jgi:hypothetical protein